MNRKLFHYGAAASLVALILLTLAWELWLAPVRPGGSFLALKAVILLAPLMGILKERLYTYQWSSMFILAFFTEGIMRSWGTAACRKPWPCGKWQSAWCSLAACWVLPVLSSANRPELSCRKRLNKTCHWQVLFFLIQSKCAKCGGNLAGILK
jgi:hypothetical protein